MGAGLMGLSRGIPVERVVEDFEFTRCDHDGDIFLASRRLGMRADALARALYRARARGLDVGFFLDNTWKNRDRDVSGRSMVGCLYKEWEGTT